MGLGFALWQRNFVMAQDAGNEAMQRISGAIQRGAQAFLSREYRAIGILVAIITLVLVLLSGLEGSGMSIWTAVSFVCGALASGLAGYIGMYIAVRANVRTTQAASNSLNQGLRVAFASGTVMGMVVVSLALLGVSILFVLLSGTAATGTGSERAGWFRLWRHLNRHLRARGVEASTPRRPTSAPTWWARPRPASPRMIRATPPPSLTTWATMLATSLAGLRPLRELRQFDHRRHFAGDPGRGPGQDMQLAGQLFPLLVAAAGLIIGMGSTFLVRTEEGATQEMLLGSLRRGIYTASALVGLAIVVIGTLLNLGNGVVAATLAGLIGACSSVTSPNTSPLPATGPRAACRKAPAAGLHCRHPAAWRWACSAPWRR